MLLLGIALYVVATARRGAIAVSLDLSVLVVSFLVALRTSAGAAELLTWATGLDQPFARPAGFLLVLLLTQIVLGLLGNRLLEAVPRGWHWSTPSRVAATVPAAAYGMLIGAAVLLLLLALPVSPGVKSDVQASSVGGRLVNEAVYVERALADIFGDAARATLTFLTVQPEAGESIDLPFRPSQTRVDEGAEARMLELVNEERTRRGLRALEVDPTLVEVARAHSLDMWERQYFAHVNPDGDDPFDRMRARASFRAAGENLALAPTVEQAHRGLMDSPGHRRNILDPGFGRVGIGAVDGGPYGLMFTQNFAD